MLTSNVDLYKKKIGNEEQVSILKKNSSTRNPMWIQSSFKVIPQNIKNN